MIKQVSHAGADTDPARFTLALEVAYELHAAPASSRAPELATGRTTARRRTRGRTTARA